MVTFETLEDHKFLIKRASWTPRRASEWLYTPKLYPEWYCVKFWMWDQGFQPWGQDQRAKRKATYRWRRSRLASGFSTITVMQKKKKKGSVSLKYDENYFQSRAEGSTQWSIHSIRKHIQVYWRSTSHAPFLGSYLKMCPSANWGHKL